MRDAGQRARWQFAPRRGGDCPPHPCWAAPWTTRWCRPWRDAFVQCGWTAVRFNFRGVGATAGVHRRRPGRAAKTCWPWCSRWRRGQPIGLAGFSFGAFVTSHALSAEAVAHSSRMGPRRAGGHGRQPLHGGPGACPRPICARWWCTASKTTPWPPLSAVMDWARPRHSCDSRARGGHFFTDNCRCCETGWSGLQSAL